MPGSSSAPASAAAFAAAHVGVHVHRADTVVVGDSLRAQRDEELALSRRAQV